MYLCIEKNYYSLFPPPVMFNVYKRLSIINMFVMDVRKVIFIGYF